MKAKDFIAVLSGNTQICVRGAFQSGYGPDEDRPDYYNGKSQDFPMGERYSNLGVVFCYYWQNGHGDTFDIKKADGLDIAVSDYEEE